MIFTFHWLTLPELRPCFIFIGHCCCHVLSPHPKRPVSFGENWFTEVGGGNPRAARLFRAPRPPPAPASSSRPCPAPWPEATPLPRPGPASPSREGGDLVAAAAAGICWKPAGGRRGGAERTVPAALFARRRVGGWGGLRVRWARERWRPSGSTSSASSSSGTPPWESRASCTASLRAAFLGYAPQPATPPSAWTSSPACWRSSPARG